jgi:hypothetical protein
LRRVVEAASASTMDDGQPSMRPPAVFISYGDWSDRTYAMRLRQYLIDEGLRVWSSIRPAPAEPDINIDGCAVFIALMTAHANGFGDLFREIQRAQDLRKAIVPLLLSGRVYASLSGYQIEDVSGGVLPGAHVLARIRLLLDPHYRPVVEAAR